MPGVVAVRDKDFIGVACDDSAKLDAAAKAVRAGMEGEHAADQFAGSVYMAEISSGE